MQPALIALIAIGLYLAIGLCFALIFVGVLVGRIDPAARGAGWGFRLLILPGAAALWPLLLRNVRTATRRGAP
jgi:hypothetical protein